ncbi:MAG: hypothetical protein ACTSVY_09170 [Candidatus Helarchaeota archaeon]
MPIGLALLGWTNKEGFFLIDCHPEYVKTYLDDETVMRIGSLHRMRKLDPNFLTLNLKKFRVASFFSGMRTAKYIITPNFTITLLLETDENPHEYSNVLPTASKEILQSLSGDKQRFDTRIARMPDVLAAIGTDYKLVLPKVYEDIISGRVTETLSVKDLLDEAGYSEDEGESQAEKQIRELQEIIRMKDESISMLQKMLTQKQENSDANSLISDMNNTIQILQKQLSDERAKVRDLTNQVQKYSAQLTKYPLLEKKSREMLEELKTLKMKNEELENKLSTYELGDESRLNKMLKEKMKSGEGWSKFIPL